MDIPFPIFECRNTRAATIDRTIAHEATFTLIEVRRRRPLAPSPARGPSKMSKAGNYGCPAAPRRARRRRQIPLEVLTQDKTDALMRRKRKEEEGESGEEPSPLLDRTITRSRDVTAKKVGWTE